MALSEEAAKQQEILGELCCFPAGKEITSESCGHLGVSTLSMLIYAIRSGPWTEATTGKALTS